MRQFRQFFFKKSFVTLHQTFSQEIILVPPSKYIQSLDNLSSSPVSALIPATMTSHLDYSHPQEDILGSSQSEHETPLPKTLHWMPTSRGVIGRVPTVASRLRVIPQNPCPCITSSSLFIHQLLWSRWSWACSCLPSGTGSQQPLSLEYSAYRYPFRKGTHSFSVFL